jgi:hypothetical protein
MGGSAAPRRKGDRLERALVRVFEQRGIVSVRVPQSGAKGGRYRGDLMMPLCGRELVAEVKHHGASFRRLYAWLRDLLLIKTDHQDVLVVLPLQLAVEILDQTILHLQGERS